MNACLLIVDDNSATLSLLSELFKEEGLESSQARSVSEAKQLITAAPQKFELVLSDIQMPKETGFDLLKWIKCDQSPNSDLPVILTTAELPEAEHRVLGLSLGAVDYVVRPIELKELVLRVLNALEHHQRIRTLQMSLEDSETLAMTGRLMAASNHEIKNLVGIVNMAAQQTQKLLEPLLADADPKAPLFRSIGALTKSSKLLTDVTRQAAQMLRPKSLPSEYIHLNKLVVEIADMMTNRVKPVRMSIAECRDDAWVQTRDVSIRQILINFILNAYEAIEELNPTEGGHIQLCIGSLQPNQWCIEVKDNGIGLAAAGVKHNFEAFHSSKILRGGQGLGLWLCSRLAAESQGSISLSSEGPGRGATAQLCIPKAEKPDFTPEEDISQYFVNQ